MKNTNLSIRQKIKREYQRGYDDGRKSEVKRMRELGAAETFTMFEELLPKIKGVGPKTYQKIMRGLRTEKHRVPNVIKFSIVVRKNEYKKYFQKGTEILWNQKKHVITQIDRIDFKDVDIKITGLCVELEVN